MMGITMIERIFHSSGINHALRGLTDDDLRDVLDTCDRGIALCDRRPDNAYRAELEEWRRILIWKMQARQLQALVTARIRETARWAASPPR